MVKLNIEPTQLKAAVEELLARARQHFPQAQVDGVLVQRMERGLAELIIGYRRDPEAGPTVLLGLGGITAELKRSFSVRIAPVSVETAHEMIGEIAELAVLRGFRNLPRGDCEALARSLHALSLLAALPQVGEAEINPLIVRGEGNGAVVVDGLVALAAGLH